jgi:prolyl oligopeptidase PreP (S9A serine peptidase family)
MVSCRAAVVTPSTWREFDTATRRFVPGGFALPESQVQPRLGRRRHAARRHRLGPEFATTGPVYARTVKVWHRSTALASAEDAV